MSDPRARWLTVLALAAASCTSADEPLGVGRQAILGGSTSDETEDATVMLVHRGPDGEVAGICTAALVAPRLVLTARHCVARANENVACDVDGTPLLGGEISGDHDAADLFVFVGKDRPALAAAGWSPNGQGLEVIDDGSPTLCDHDLALVLLKEPIAGVPPVSLRLEREVRAGERLSTVGWGVSSSEMEPSQRRRRGGVTARRVGPDDAVPVLTSSEFLFDESICLGDSGGPIFSEETGAIVGVVSRGGNGVDPRSGGPAATCVDADNLGTKLAPFRARILAAFEHAGAAPTIEPPPDEGGCSAPARRAPASLAASACVALALLLVTRLRRGRREKGLRPDRQSI